MFECVYAGVENGHSGCRISRFLSRFRFIFKNEFFKVPYKMMLREKRTSLEFNQALHTEGLRRELLDRSRYFWHLNSYRKYFKDKNIGCFFYEDFKGDYKGIINKIFDFLGVCHNDVGENIHLKRSKKDEKIVWQSETYKYVLEELRDDCYEYLKINNKPHDFWDMSKVYVKG